MSEPKLIFSFGPGLNFAVDNDTLARGPVIKFGVGIDDLDISSTGMAFIAVGSEIAIEEKPTVEFNFKSEEEFPKLKRKMTNSVHEAADKSAAVGKSVVIKGVESAPRKLKSVVEVKEKTSGKDFCYAVPSVFEVGSSSKSAHLTRTQRRNRNKKLQRALIRQRKEVELTESGAGYGEYEMPETSPLLGGSRFHPLSAAKGEENVKRIAASPPKPFEYTRDQGNKKHSFSRVRSVFERLGAREDCSVDEILDRMGSTVSHHARRQILKRDHTRSGSNFRRMERYDFRNDSGNRRKGYQHETRRHTARKDYREHLRVRRPLGDSIRSKPRNEVRSAPSNPPLSSKLLDDLKSRSNNKKSLQPVAEPCSREHPLPVQNDVVVKPPSYSTSYRKREWIPKTVSSQVENKVNEKIIPEKERTISTKGEPERYVPVEASRRGGRSVEEILEELRLELLKIKEEYSKEERQQEANDKRVNDDLMDEDLDHPNEEYASVNMVETRASSGQQTVQDADEENESSQSLLQQIQQRDEEINELKKQMKDMMIVMSSLQGQPQPPPVRLVEASPPEIVQISENNKPVTAINDDSSMKRVTEYRGDQAKEIKQMVEQQVREALAQAKGQASILRGRPYPEEFDAVPYPKGYVPPSFKVFDGTGNPRQHIACFRVSCCNAGGSDALLLRQFVSSLAGIAFDWYANLPNDSFRTFAELEISS